MTSNSVRRARRRRLVWAVPAVTAGAVVAGALVITPASSAPNPKLAPRTAQQLLVAVGSSATTSMSGTVVENAKLGLPTLPGGPEGASLSWQTLLAGSHTAHVWIAGPDKQRLALKGSLSEADVVRNGKDLWTYTSQTNEASHTVLTPKSNRADAPARPDEVPLTPTAAARQVLKSIDPSTRVTVDSTQWVAGRKAYTLVLSPRDARSTVRKVTIAIDSVHSVPLQVQVFGAGKAPAFKTGFTQVSFAAAKASVFNFKAPRGAKIVADPLDTSNGARRQHAQQGNAQRANARPTTVTRAKSAQPRTIGKGWTTIVELPAGLPAGANRSLLDNLTVPVGTTGNRLLQTALVNVLFCKNGRVFSGAVSPALLEKTAAATR